jgi:hypothetical protein
MVDRVDLYDESSGEVVTAVYRCPLPHATGVPSDFDTLDAAQACQDSHEQPDWTGEYPCSHCGTPGGLCLDQINRNSALEHCCAVCGFADTHRRPGREQPQVTSALPHC